MTDIDVGEGYRRLELSDFAQQGDEYLSNDDVWHPIDAGFGEAYTVSDMDEDSVYRRKETVLDKATPEDFREAHKVEQAIAKLLTPHTNKG